MRSLTLYRAAARPPARHAGDRLFTLAVWTAAGFSGTVSDGPGAPNGNYTIKSQSLTATSSVPCSSSVTVNNP